MNNLEKADEARVGDICNYWNKTVIVHKLGPEPGWAEVLKIKNPNIPSQVSGVPFSVRLTQLNIVKRARTS
jgi:hypothetical protein